MRGAARDYNKSVKYYQKDFKRFVNRKAGLPESPSRGIMIDIAHTFIYSATTLGVYISSTFLYSYQLWNLRKLLTISTTILL